MTPVVWRSAHFPGMGWQDRTGHPATDLTMAFLLTALRLRS